MTTLEQVQQRAENDAKTYDYYLNPDSDFLRNLIEGLKINEERYGYPSCPCRLASGKYELDRDIICPCDYRDPDIEEFGFCYCALYVRKDVFEGRKTLEPIPERRPKQKQARSNENSKTLNETIFPLGTSEVKSKMWYCRQCGYVVFREDPPYICPICKAKRENFAEIKIIFS